MKKLTLFFAGVYAATYGVLTAADPDFVKGFDFTGQTSLSAAKLNQLVDNGYIGATRGLVIYSATTPNVGLEPKLARYIWLNTGTTPPIPKIWNATLSLWVNITADAAITASSIYTGAIQANAVTSTQLGDNSVISAKLAANSVITDKIAANAITNTHIINLGIQGAKLADLTVTSGKIAPSAITGDKIAANAVSVANLTNGFALTGANIAPATITSANVAAGGIALTNITLTGAVAGSSLVVNAAATALEYSNEQTIYRSPLYTINTTAPLNVISGEVVHNLGGSPDIVRVFIVRTGVTAAGSTDLGYNTGDIVPAEYGVYENQSFQSPFSVTFNSTVISIYRESVLFHIAYKAGGPSPLAVSEANFAIEWRIKFVAIRFKQ